MTAKFTPAAIAHLAKRRSATLSAKQSARSKVGTATENVVERIHDRIAASGIATLVKMPTPMRIIGVGPKGSVRAVHVKKASVDFMGCMSDGRHVAVEVKRIQVELSKRTKLPLPPALSMSRVEPQQRAHLDFVSDASGVAVLLIVHGSTNVYAVPWHAVGKLKTLNGAFLSDYKCKPGELYLYRWSDEHEAAA